jgi:hypothetical protein
MKHILCGMDEPEYQNTKGAVRLLSSTTRCHPRYRLPRYLLTYHTSQSTRRI